MKPALLIAVALLLPLTGCGDAAPETGTPVASATTTTMPPAEPSRTTTGSKCLSVGKAMAAAIVSGAETGTGISAGPAAAVKSPDHAKVYLVAVRVKIPGVGDEVGVWASNSLTPGEGLIMAVDGIAKEFTVWPDADRSAAKISSADEAVRQAKNCLG